MWAAALVRSGRRGGEQRRLDAYVPPVLLRQLAHGTPAPVRTEDATVLFADISGFTQLSERLARRGREGAEELTQTIDATFGALLDMADRNGGDLLKHAGDALLLLFEGDDHVARACDSAVGMRHALRDVGRLRTSAGPASLRMSQGVHSGEFHLFLVGESHRELLLAGPGATAGVAMEKAAGAGDILLSPATAKRLPAQSLGAARGPGILLASAPAVEAAPARELGGDVANDDVADCLSTAVRAHLAGSAPPPEHRNVTVAFLRFEGTDELIAREGPERAAARLDELIAIVQRAADDQDVCFLESDVDADGGKVMLTAGAPRIVGDDEERMLLALRRIVESEPPLPIRIGVNGGNV